MNVPNLRTMAAPAAKGSKNTTLDHGATNSIHDKNVQKEATYAGGVPKKNLGGENTRS